MHKKLLWICGCIFAVLLILSACGTKSIFGNAEQSENTDTPILSFSQTEYELAAGESAVLMPNGNANRISYSVRDESIASVDEDGVLHALAVGETTVTASAEGADSVILTVTVTEKGIDVDQNRLYANAASEAMQDYYQSLSAKETLTVLLSTCTGEQTNTAVLHIRRDPFYIDYISNGSEHPTVIRKEGEKIFRYTYQSSFFYGNYYQRDYLYDYEDLPSLTELTGIDAYGILTLVFDPEKGSASFDEVKNVYTFTALYANILDDATKETITKAIESFGLSESDLENSEVTLAVSLGEKVSVTSDLTVTATYYGAEITLPITLSYTFSSENFEEYDFSNDNISRPSSLKEVDTSWTYDFTSDYVIYGLSTDYLYVHLLPGQYVIKAKDGYSSYLSATLYASDDEDSAVHLLGTEEVRFFSSSFIAEEEGDYYLVIRNSLSSVRKLVLEKLDYQTVCQKQAVTPDEWTEGSLEGAWDAVHYGGTPDKDTLAKITNTGNCTIQIIAEIYEGGWESHSLKKDDSLVIMLSESGYDFFVCEDNSDAESTYSFTFNTIENENGTETDFSDLDVIQNEWSEKEYMAGYGLPDRAVKLHLTEKALVQLLSQPCDGCGDVTFAVEDTEGNRIDTADGKAGWYVLDAGDYRVLITNPQNTFGIAKVRYETVKIEDKDIAVTLKQYETAEDAYDGGYSGFFTDQLVSVQNIHYCFTLAEDSILFLYESEVSVYREDGTLLTLPTAYQNGYSYLSLDAGKYYCTVADFDLYASSPIPIALVEQGAESMRWNESHLQTVTSGETYHFTKESNFDKEYLLIDSNCDLEWTISISGGTCRIYTEDGKSVTKSSTNGFTLSAGRYIVVISYNRTSAVSIQLTGKAVQSGVGDL